MTLRRTFTCLATACCTSSALVLCVAVPRTAYARDSAPDWVKAAVSAATAPVAPDAPAIVLFDDTVYTVANDGKAVEHRRSVVKILRPAGRQYGVVMVPFDSDTRILSLKVWSIAPDGQEYAVKDKEIAEVGEPNSGSLYSDMRARIATPPGRDPGGVIAYEYEQRQRPYSHEADWFFQSDIPRLHQAYTLELPAGFSYVNSWSHHPPQQPADLEHQRYRWELASMPAIDLEQVSMAPAINSLVGRMSVHYGATGQSPALGTWQEVGYAYDQIARDRIVATPEIAAKAAQLTAGKSGFYEKAEAIAEFVQRDIRYFVIEKGIGGIQPHPAADIFRNRYGDCKDKATLLAAMINSQGLHATLVLVDTDRGFINPETPSSLGNHAIAAIEIPAGFDSPQLRSVVTARSGKRYLIVDPTWTRTAFGQLEANLQGGYGVLVEGRESEIVHFPVLAPALNTVQRSGALQLKPDGSLAGSVIEKRFGDISEHLRWLYSEGDVKQQQAWMNARLGRDFPAFTVSDFKVDGVQTLNRPVVDSFTLSVDRYSRSMGPLLMVRPRVMGSQSIAIDHKPRLYPIDLEQTFEDREDFTIDLPQGYAVDELPAPVKLDLGFAAYESATTLDGNRLRYTRTYTVRELTLPAERYADLQKMARTIEGDEQNRAVFKKQ